MHLFRLRLGPIFKTFRLTTLPLEIIDRKNFAAQFYHLKVEVGG